MSKMPIGLSRFPVDFNTALRTAAGGKLLPRSSHKITDPPPSYPPPLIEDSNSWGECKKNCKTHPESTFGWVLIGWVLGHSLIGD